MSWGFRSYVSAAEKLAKASRYIKKLEKQGVKLQPVRIEGRAIATTFWGKAWCDNLERYCDFENRLPRGRTYARNGSIIDLQIHKGRITAIVQGSDIYEVTIELSPLARKDWKKITQDCSQSIHSLLDLLQGRFSDGVMERLVRPKEGMFPQPEEIQLRCSCPDWADLCKHAAAVLYGVGARLDIHPELLFLLRQVDQSELVHRAAKGVSLKTALGSKKKQSLQNQDLGELFGIDLESSAGSKKTPHSPRTKPKAAIKSPAAKEPKSARKLVTLKTTKPTRTKKSQPKVAIPAVSQTASKRSAGKSASSKPAKTPPSKITRSPKKAAHQPVSNRKTKSGTAARPATRKSKDSR